MLLSSFFPLDVCLSLLVAPVLKMGGAGDPPAPVGDPPTGTPASNVANRRSASARTVAPGPSGDSPDGPGGSPMLPSNDFSNTLLESFGGACFVMHHRTHFTTGN